MNVAYTITPTGVLFFMNGKSYQVGSDHPNFTKIKGCLTEKKYSDIIPLMDVRASVRNWFSSNRRFTLVNDMIHLDGIPFTEEVTNKVLSMIDEGWNPEPLFNFLTKVRNNPSSIAQKELLLFCVANGFMIHEDGDILAYKSVRDNYTDIHSGKFLNTVGSVHSMPRNQVDDDRERTCSHGLHFAAYEYASTWSSQIGHLMLVKINPADVVSIPSDYSNQKGRTWKYQVVGEVDIKKPLPKKEVYTTSDYDDAYDPYDDLEDDDDCYDCDNTIDSDGWCPCCEKYVW